MSKKLFTFFKTKKKTPTKIDLDDFLLANFEIKEQEGVKTQLITIEIDETQNTEFIVLPSLNEIRQINQKMVNFIENNNFTEENKQNFYKFFKIPKRKGGYRELIDPQDDLKKLQRDILDFLQNDAQIKIHNCAHAFTPERDMYTNAIQHKNSTFFITLDIKSFFPSLTEKIVKTQLLNNYTIFKMNEQVNDLVDNIIKISCLNGALPQGSPVSPFLSNVVMTQFDYELCKKMRDNKIPYYTYTRYADDMCFSSTKLCKEKELPNMIQELLDTIYNNGIKLNSEKTKILKNTNKVYITGIKINKDNQATFGYENKTKLKLELYNLFKAQQAQTLCKEQVQEVLGRFSFMSRIEPNYADYIQKKLLRDMRSNSNTFSQHFKEFL